MFKYIELFVNKKIDMHAVMGAALLIFLVVLVNALFTIGLPEQIKDAIMLIIGAVLNQLGNVYQFYFGDTKRGAVSDETISTMATSAAAPLKETRIVERTDVGPEETGVTTRGSPEASTSGHSGRDTSFPEPPWGEADRLGSAR